MTNRRVLLKSRPVGEPKPTDFEIADAPVPKPQDGEILVRTIWLSLDPYMRGRMNDVKSYAASVELGQPLVGGTVGEAVESRDAAFHPGDLVLTYGGWQAYHVAKSAASRVGPFGPIKLDPKAAPISTALGVLGMPGMTAYVGLYDLGQPKPGETVVVSAAAGAPWASRRHVTNASTFSTSSASTRACRIGCPISRACCATRVRRASTSTSTTSAVRY